MYIHIYTRIYIYIYTYIYAYRQYCFVHHRFHPNIPWAQSPPMGLTSISRPQTCPISNFLKFAIILTSPSSKIQTCLLRHEDYGHAGGWGLLPLCGVGEGSDVPLAQRDHAAAARCGGGLTQRCQLWWAADSPGGPYKQLEKNWDCWRAMGSLVGEIW